MSGGFVLLALQLAAFTVDDCGNCMKARVPVYQWQQLGVWSSADACSEASKTLIAQGVKAADVKRFLCINTVTGRPAREQP